MAKIWLIDDDKNLTHLTKIALGDKGYEVIVFHSAQKAIEASAKQKPNLILMDIMLPEISGAEAVKILHKNTAFKDVPIVFLTGLISNQEAEVEKTGISIEGIEYKTLGKPYEIDQLLNLVANSLR